MKFIGSVAAVSGMGIFADLLKASQNKKKK
jgi:hypothetical protein